VVYVPFSEQARKHFQYLINDYGFSQEDRRHRSDYEIVFRRKSLFQPKKGCRIRVVKDRGQVLVDIAPLWTPNDWFDLCDVVSYLTRRTGEPWEYKFPDRSLGRYERIEWQLEYVSEALRLHLDAILQLFQKDTFEQKRRELKEYGRELLDQWLERRAAQRKIQGKGR
jgi:hypothetical protein